MLWLDRYSLVVQLTENVQKDSLWWYEKWQKSVRIVEYYTMTSQQLQFLKVFLGQNKNPGSFFMYSVNQNLTSLLFANNRMIFVITGLDMKMNLNFNSVAF